MHEGLGNNNGENLFGEGSPLHPEHYNIKSSLFMYNLEYIYHLLYLCKG